MIDPTFVKEVVASTRDFEDAAERAAATMAGRERMFFETLTDEDLTTPVGDLPEGKRMVLQHVLQGPLGDELMERIDALVQAKKATT